MKPTILPILTLALCLPAQAALTWTGGGDKVSLYQEANWQDDTGSTPAANTINGNTAISAATGGLVDISSGLGSPNNFGGNFVLSTGDSLNVTGKILKTTGTSTLTGGGAGSSLNVGSGGTVQVGAVGQFSNLTIDGGSLLLNSTAGITTATGSSLVSVLNGGSINTQFISNTFTMSIDATSIVTFRGGGNPVNGGPVDLEIGAIVNFLDETPADFTSQHLAKFDVGGVDAVIGSNLSVVSDGATGSIVTAIPESSAALFGSLGVLLLFRRRSRG